VWKIADFGLSAEGTSRRERTTEYSRGTPSYRPPELIREKSTYTNKVDIWAIGCILYELVFQRTAFDGDMAVWEYNLSKEPLEIPVEIKLRPKVTGEDPHSIRIPSVTVLRTVVHSALERIHLKRPSADNLSLTFCHAYIWELSNDVPTVKQIVELLDGSGPMTSYNYLMLYRFYRYAATNTH